MVVAFKHQEYPRKPLECWAKGNELRRMHFRLIWETAKLRERPLVVMGVGAQFRALCAGFGDFVYYSVGPYSSGIHKDREQLANCMRACNAYGYGRDICDYMRLHLGQLLLGMSNRSPQGEKVTPDVVLQTAWCHSTAYMSRMASQRLEVPHILIEGPPFGDKIEQKYVVGQFQEAIEKIQKLTGREYDDEKLIQAVKNEWRTASCLARILMLMQNIPTPMDVTMYFAVQRPAYTMRHLKDVADFYEELLAELTEHVRLGISARGFEKTRVSFETGPPTFAWGTSYFRYPEKYGAVTITSAVSHPGDAAVFDRDDKGTWQPVKPLEQMKIEPKNREEALWALAELYVGETKVSGVDTINFEERVRRVDEKVTQWRSQVVIFTVHHSCHTQGGVIPEAQLRAKAKGIPNVLVENPDVDVLDFDEVTWKETIDTFFEDCMGLKPLQ